MADPPTGVFFSWQGTIPALDAPSVLCPELKSELMPGSFVSIRHNGESFIGRILSEATDGKSVLINRFRPLFTDNGSLEIATSVQRDYSHVASYFTELYQTREFIFLPHSSISGLAFVFARDELADNDNLLWAAGLPNVYYMRFRLDPCLNAIQEFEEEGFSPFPSCHLA